MVAERSDDYYVGRLIGRIRLLIATNDAMPVEVKLQAQPMLKELEQMLAASPDERDHGRVRAHYAYLCRELADEPDLEALLGALRNFVPGL